MLRPPGIDVDTTSPSGDSAEAQHRMDRDVAGQNPAMSSDRVGVHQNSNYDPNLLKMQSKQGSEAVANNPKRGSGLMQRILQTIDLWAQKYTEVSTR